MNDNITEINKDTFWELIQNANNACGQDMDANDGLPERPADIHGGGAGAELPRHPQCL